MKLWTTALVALVVILVIASAVLLFVPAEGKYDAFASCLSEKGAVFYGAFWCPHCSDQKNMFGSSAKYIPYVECSTSDGRSQLQVCRDAGVEGYPTWVFADGSMLSGIQSFSTLAERTGCTVDA